MAFIGAFLALLVWLVSHIVPIYIPLVIAVVLWIVGVKNEYQVRKIIYNTEKHGTWGSGNPYPLGTIEHDLYETKKIWKKSTKNFSFRNQLKIAPFTHLKHSVSADRFPAVTAT